MDGVLLTPQETGRRLGGVPVATLKHWRYRGTGPRYVRVGRNVRYDPRDVDAWQRAQTIDPAARTA